MQTSKLARALSVRFGAPVHVPETLAQSDTLTGIAGRGSCRWFTDAPVSEEVLRSLSAGALCAPSKSDLQQRDIVILQDPEQVAAVKALLTGQDWIAGAPSLLIFCANNRRQRQMHAWWKRPFVNDHLDAFFNAAVDAGIALATFVTAAEAVGLGCCPISAIRNSSDQVSRLLDLPDHVFPVAALAVGHPEHAEPRISMRLPLSSTVHTDRFTEEGLCEAVSAYDAQRAAHRPLRNQRDVDRFGEAPRYTWSDDKTRQYASPEREDFGRFIADKGFRLR